MEQSARNEWAKVQGRYVDIPFSVSIEDVITLIGNAIEGPKPEHGVRQLCLNFTKALNHPRYNGFNNFESKLAETWPLHPMSAILLGPLSRRKFSQNERSIFSFLASSEPAGFKSFLSSIDLGGGRHCYEPSMLWDYLQFNMEPQIVSSPDGHRWSEAAEAVERAFRLKSPLAAPITKLIGLIEVFGRPYGIVASDEILRQCFVGRKNAAISTALKEIEKASIAVFRRHLQAWGLYAGSDIDLDRLVSEASVQVGDNIASMTQSIPVLQPIVAKRHYHETGTLRWFDFRISSSDKMSVSTTFSANDRGQSGSFLLLLPSGQRKTSDLNKLARKLVSQNLDSGNLISVGVPSNTSRLASSVQLTTSLERVSVMTPELEGDKVARRELDGRLNAAHDALRRELDKVIVTADWYLPARKKPLKGSVGLTKVASELSDVRFHSSPTLINELINRNRPVSHPVPWTQVCLMRRA